MIGLSLNSLWLAQAQRALGHLKIQAFLQLLSPSASNEEWIP